MTPFPFWRSIAYAEHSTKQRWHAKARIALRSLAHKLELAPGTYCVRSNYGGVAVSGESILHGEHIYVQVAQVGVLEILFRRCNGRGDYTGAENHFARLPMLNEPEALAALIEGELGPCYKSNANAVMCWT